VIEASGLPVVAAGGVSSLADLVRLRELGCEGAIAGAALWSGRFTLTEALGLGA
jgi:phosphoribosylformimino-5-aminoimidazole carboxamide ribonucleotide (ProFAR) isomerase